MEKQKGEIFTYVNSVFPEDGHISLRVRFGLPIVGDF